MSRAHPHAAWSAAPSFSWLSTSHCAAQPRFVSPSSAKDGTCEQSPHAHLTPHGGPGPGPSLNPQTVLLEAGGSAQWSSSAPSTSDAAGLGLISGFALHTLCLEPPASLPPGVWGRGGLAEEETGSRRHWSPWADAAPPRNLPEPEGSAGAGLAFPLPHSWGFLTLGVRKVAKSVAGMFMVEPPKLSPSCVLQAMWA